jgi:DNA recombination protein RmuC
MPTIPGPLLLLGAAFALGCLLTWLAARVHHSSLQAYLSTTASGLRDKTQQLESANAALRDALEAKARAEQDAQRVPHLEAAIAGLTQTNSDLQVRLAEFTRELTGEQEKAQWVARAQESMREAFQALAAQTLQSNAEGFLQRAREHLDTLLAQIRGDWGAHRQDLARLVEPLEESLRALDAQVRDLEQKRAGAYQSVQEQLRQLGETHRQLETTTITLAQALKSSGVRGRWGEVQLRRVVELAGLVEHVDFEEQASTETGRPDMIVHLPHDSLLPVDAKAPMQAYLEAMEAPEADRGAKLDMHVRALRQHVQTLASRRYWQQFERAPELVVMFVPNDACVAAAFERAPDLLDFAMQNRVLPTTPITLLALLKAVAYGWQQQRIAENAREIAEQGKQLHERLRAFVTHLADLGRRLDRVVDTYNDAVGSLESRVMPAARRFREMGAPGEELPALAPVDRRSRVPTIGEEARTPVPEVSLVPGDSAPPDPH